eukprot:2639181-Amphidinium_carterae.1
MVYSTLLCCCAVLFLLLAVASGIYSGGICLWTHCTPIVCSKRYSYEVSLHEPTMVTQYYMVRPARLCGGRRLMNHRRHHLLSKAVAHGSWKHGIAQSHSDSWWSFHDISYQRRGMLVLEERHLGLGRWGESGRLIRTYNTRDKLRRPVMVWDSDLFDAFDQAMCAEPSCAQFVESDKEQKAQTVANRRTVVRERTGGDNIVQPGNVQGTRRVSHRQPAMYEGTLCANAIEKEKVHTASHKQPTMCAGTLCDSIIEKGMVCRDRQCAHRQPAMCEGTLCDSIIDTGKTRHASHRQPTMCEGTLFDAVTEKDKLRLTRGASHRRMTMCKGTLDDSRTEKGMLRKNIGHDQMRPSAAQRPLNA